MRQGNPDDRKNRYEYLCADAAYEQVAEPLEHVPSEKCLFPEAGFDNQHGNECRSGGSVSGQEVIRLIDRVGTEKRHHYRFHQEFEPDAESDADNQATDPVSGAHIAYLTPRRA